MITERVEQLSSFHLNDTHSRPRKDVEREGHKYECQRRGMLEVVSRVKPYQLHCDEFCVDSDERLGIRKFIGRQVSMLDESRISVPVRDSTKGQNDQGVNVRNSV